MSACPRPTLPADCDEPVMLNEDGHWWVDWCDGMASCKTCQITLDAYEKEKGPAPSLETGPSSG